MFEMEEENLSVRMERFEEKNAPLGLWLRIGCDKQWWRSAKEYRILVTIIQECVGG